MVKKIWRRLWGKPINDSGFVYYVKLKTDKGVFYKIGFTKKKTVEERFLFPGLGDEKLIEKVFVFKYRSDAYKVEQRLHKYFSKQLAFGKYSSDKNMPLYQRGQGELYRNDVLGLDKDLYIKESKILTESVENSFGGCLFIIFLLVGVIGVPLGGWGIPILIIAGCWWLIQSSKEMEGRLYKIKRKPRHSQEIESLIISLENKNSNDKSKGNVLQKA